MDNRGNNLIRGGNLKEYSGPVRCQRCITYNTECFVAEKDKCCMSCQILDKEDECFFTRTVSRKLYKKDFTWEEMNGENILPHTEPLIQHNTGSYQEAANTIEGGPISLGEFRPLGSNNSPLFIPEDFPDIQEENTTFQEGHLPPTIGHADTHGTRHNPNTATRRRRISTMIGGEENSAPDPSNFQALREETFDSQGNAADRSGTISSPTKKSKHATVTMRKIGACHSCRMRKVMVSST